MKELYYWNGSKKGRTWREVLQGIHEDLNKPREKHWWSRSYIDAPAYQPERINRYFQGWRHNPNDGGHWTNGRYDRIFVGFDPETREKVYINGDWHDPEWKVKEGGTCLTDSYGRVIPSGFVKACYLRFKPDTSVKKKQRFYYNFRGTGTGHVSCGMRTGNHGGFASWKRSWYAHDVDRKEIYEEYGIMMKTQKIIPYIYSKSEGRGWKRSKKKKQWM